MTTAQQYQYERGRLEHYRATLNQRMACAPTPAARKQILDEGEALAARLDQLADDVRREGEAARNAASPSREPAQRYDTAICSVRCVVFPLAWSLRPPTAAEHVAELHRIEGRWTLAKTPEERAVVAGDAERLAKRLRNNSIIDVKMPAAQLEELNTTNGIIEQLARDIGPSPAVDDGFKSAWRAFRDEWRKFYAGHQGWTDRVWYSTYEKTVEYRRRARDWRDDFEAKGGHATGPKDTPPETASAIPWRKILVGAGVGVGALVGLNLLMGRR
jgi:hypothetical protein